jgi:hypothetical protein
MHYLMHHLNLQFRLQPVEYYLYLEFDYCSQQFHLRHQQWFLNLKKPRLLLRLLLQLNRCWIVVHHHHRHHQQLMFQKL